GRPDAVPRACGRSEGRVRRTPWRRISICLACRGSQSAARLYEVNEGNRSVESPTLPVARTTLFVPADRPDRYAKALGSGADIVCVDLEDAVACVNKAAARDAVAGFFTIAAKPEVRRALRINSLSTLDGLKD